MATGEEAVDIGLRVPVFVATAGVVEWAVVAEALHVATYDAYCPFRQWLKYAQTILSNLSGHQLHFMQNQLNIKLYLAFMIFTNYFFLLIDKDIAIVENDIAITPYVIAA